MKLVVSIRDKSKVEAFAREVAGMIGVDIDDVRAEVRRARGRPRSDAGSPGPVRRGPAVEAPPPPRRDVPDPAERRYSIERDVLKIVLQAPAAIAATWDQLDESDFTHPYYRELFDVVNKLGGPTAVSVDGLRETVTDDRPPDAAVGAVGRAAARHR